MDENVESKCAIQLELKSRRRKKLNCIKKPRLEYLLAFLLQRVISPPPLFHTKMTTKYPVSFYSPFSIYSHYIWLIFICNAEKRNENEFFCYRTHTHIHMHMHTHIYAAPTNEIIENISKHQTKFTFSFCDWQHRKLITILLSSLIDCFHYPRVCKLCAKQQSKSADKLAGDHLLKSKDYKKMIMRN